MYVCEVQTIREINCRTDLISPAIYYLVGNYKPIYYLLMPTVEIVLIQVEKWFMAQTMETYQLQQNLITLLQDGIQL